MALKLSTSIDDIVWLSPFLVFTRGISPLRLIVQLHRARRIAFLQPVGAHFLAARRVWGCFRSCGLGCLTLLALLGAVRHGAAKGRLFAHLHRAVGAGGVPRPGARARVPKGLRRVDGPKGLGYKYFHGF
jgi:hypothetical protein